MSSKPCLYHLSSVCVLLALLFQQHSGLCHICFYGPFSPPLFIQGTLWVTSSSRAQWCHINWQCFQIHMQFKFFTLQLLLFNEYECIYGMTYKYIHTYKQTPLELKMLMWGLLRLTPIIEEEKIHKSQQIASVGLTCVGITRSN